MPEEELRCECGAPATWMRYTQFSGNHPYCTHHAQQEEDFGKDESSYFGWGELPVEIIAPKHPTEVEGYEGELELLVKRIHNMSYDRVVEFYRLGVDEIQRQSEGDAGRGHPQVANCLAEAAWYAGHLKHLFLRIWDICKPHMQEQEEEKK